MASASAAFFGDDVDGEYGIFVLWDTQAQADDAAALISPRLEQHLARKVKGEAGRRLFAVIDAPYLSAAMLARPDPEMPIC